jgi:Na+-translocating ferredoxin:NAD+ oxidoreductase RnfC subunit
VLNVAETVKQCGVVGAGGAGFPTHVKLQARADIVIVNGAECEPLLCSDEYLMERDAGRLVRGTGYIMQSCGAGKAYIALKEKHAEAVRILKKALSSCEGVELYLLEDVYPAGDEFLLVYDITGRVVPEGGIPPDVGCVVDNVETVVNICAAVEERRPVITRYLSCTGEVGTPSIVRAHIGCSLQHVIDICGGATVEEPVVLLGGPMMGGIETDLQTPVSKTTSAIIVLPRDHPMVRQKTMSMDFIIKQVKSACCQCTYCTELCPRYLLGHDLKPHMIMRQIAHGLDVPAGVIQNALLCSGCGLCETYACVMGLSPHVVNRTIRERFASAGYRPVYSTEKPVVHEMRDYRLIPTNRLQGRLHLQHYYERAMKRDVHTDPDRVEILRCQHIGEQATVKVEKGVRVAAGTVIAEMKENALGSSIHASMDGVVSFIDDERIIIEKRG